MSELVNKLLKEKYGIPSVVLDKTGEALVKVDAEFKIYDEIREFNQLKVLNAFHEERVSDSNFVMSTGYGYDDIGRDKLDRVYSRIFGCEAALVRPHFVNGTHAISSALFGVLRHGDTLLTITGRPYDTLHNVIGIGKKKGVGSLMEMGVLYKEIDLKNGDFDVDSIKSALTDPSLKMIHIQRSTGYSWRKSMDVTSIGNIIKIIKELRDDVVVFVDNCYGEFVETIEPTDVGADLIAGSLIKNPGGSIVPTGGYICGRKDLVDLASYRLTVPGIGGECGSTFGVTRLMFQGLFLAPHISMEAVKGAVFAAALLESFGYEVKPRYNERRTDIIQAIKFNDPVPLIKFVKGIQYGAPVDSMAECEPWDMPGYDDKIIMASGSFVQGSSIELSCDAPIREPYIAYLQGGITFDHAKTGILIALANTLK